MLDRASSLLQSSISFLSSPDRAVSLSYFFLLQFSFLSSLAASSDGGAARGKEARQQQLWGLDTAAVSTCGEERVARLRPRGGRAEGAEVTGWGVPRTGRWSSNGGRAQIGGVEEMDWAPWVSTGL
jgi:hypothetical protein